MFKFNHYFACTGIIFCLLISAGASAKSSYTLPNGEVLSDPTKPFGAKAKQALKTKVSRPKLTLNYIMSAGDNRRAMINGEKVHVGDYVSGARVSKISSDSVSLVYDGQEFVLRLKKLIKIKK